VKERVLASTFTVAKKEQCQGKGIKPFSGEVTGEVGLVGKTLKTGETLLSFHLRAPKSQDRGGKLHRQRDRSSQDPEGGG